ncbi:hypothetical protein V8E53_012396 [Lactarius tabidus]
MDVADRIPSRIGQQDNRADDGANAKTMQKGSRFCEYGLGHSPSLSWVNLANYEMTQAFIRSLQYLAPSAHAIRVMIVARLELVSIKDSRNQPICDPDDASYDRRDRRNISLASTPTTAQTERISESTTARRCALRQYAAAVSDAKLLKFQLGCCSVTSQQMFAPLKEEGWQKACFMSCQTNVYHQNRASLSLGTYAIMEEVLGAKVYHPRDGNVKGVAVEEGPKEDDGRGEERIRGQMGFDVKAAEMTRRHLAMTKEV